MRKKQKSSIKKKGLIYLSDPIQDVMSMIHSFQRNVGKKPYAIITTPENQIALLKCFKVDDDLKSLQNLIFNNIPILTPRDFLIL